MNEQQRTGRFSSLATNAGLAVLSLAATVAVSEIGLRLIGYKYNPLQISDETERDDRVSYMFANEDFVSDPELIWRPRAGHSVFNEQGFRGPVLEGDKLPGEIRVVALGDSNTLGWAGVSGPNWPAMVGERLRERRRGVTLVNAGVWGYSSHQGLARLRESLELAPDLVTISFGGNDAHRVRASDERLSRGLRGSALVQWLTEFRVGQAWLFLLDVLETSRRQDLEPRVELSRYRANLREMIAATRAGGAEAVLLTRPFTGDSPDPLWWKNFGRDYNQATVEIGAEMGAPVIDIYTHFKDSAELFDDESHFNRDGHVLAARLIASRLLPLLPR